MNKKSMPPIILGHKYKKGLLGFRSKMGGYDIFIVSLKKEYQTGENYELKDIDMVHTVLHFCDKSAVEETIKCLKWILKQGIEEV